MAVFTVFEIHPVADADPTKLADLERYRAAVRPMIEAAGGRYLARAVEGELLEGDADPGRFHLIEWADADQVRNFWHSEEYRALAPLREGAVRVRAVLLDPRT